MTDQMTAWPDVEEVQDKALSMAKVTIIGTLADDPRVQPIDGNNDKVGLSVYTSSHWYSSKERCEHTEKQWHRIVITEPALVAYAIENLARGDQVYIEGGLHTCYWYDTLYERRSLTSIIVWRDGHKLARVDEEPMCDELEIALVRKALDGDTELACPSGAERPRSGDDRAIRHVA